jgi:hypothetical protein
VQQCQQYVAAPDYCAMLVVGKVGGRFIPTKHVAVPVQCLSGTDVDDLADDDAVVVAQKFTLVLYGLSLHQIGAGRVLQPAHRSCGNTGQPSGLSHSFSTAKRSLAFSILAAEIGGRPNRTFRMRAAA